MTESKDITDELREWGSQNLYLPAEFEKLTVIADRIDTAYEKALSQAYMDMSDSEWIRLPKDSDGEPIHIGDVMDNTHKDGFTAKLVIGISYREDDIYVRVDEDKLRWHTANKLRHHKQPTIEDILAEFADKWVHVDPCKDSEVIAEYATKLREMLAGDAE